MRAIGFTAFTRRSWRVVVMTLATVVALTLAVIGAPASSAHGAVAQVGKTTAFHATSATAHATSGTACPSTTATQTPRMVPLSTADAHAHILAAFGPKVGAYLLSRMRGTGVPLSASHSLGECFGSAFAAHAATATAPLGASGANATSQYWGGVVVSQKFTGTVVAGASADYRLRDVCGTCPQLVTWTGVGGWNNITNPTIEQDGVDQRFNVAWYEFYPNAAVGTSMTVSNGDSLYTYMTEVRTNVWEVYMFDNTVGGSDYYQSDFSWTANDTTSGEWVTEFPAGNGAVPYFAGIPFSNAVWYDSSLGIHALNDSGIENDVELKPTNNGGTCIKVSGLLAENFQNNWINTSC